MRGKILLSSLLISAAIATQANAYSINDDYWGGTLQHTTTNRDVIGMVSHYGVEGMNVSDKKVDIYGQYFSVLNLAQMFNEGSKIGDLFISNTGWNPAGADIHHVTDNYLTTGTNWNYVAVLSPHIPQSPGDFTTSGTVKLYQINPDTGIVNTTNVFPHPSFERRSDQLYSYIPGQGESALATGRWSIIDQPDTNIDLLSINIDLTQITKVPGVGDWAYHWTMTCGNDVIEGSVPVPEPGTIALLGAGLLGLGIYGRRRAKK